jgi:hypothetical protein
MKTLFLIVILIHGLIHLLGVAKAFRLAEVRQLTIPLSKGFGILWLVAALLFLLAIAFLLLAVPLWWIVAALAVLSSQYLIIRNWADAKFGSIPNLIILLPVMVAFLNALPSSFQNRYETEVKFRLDRVPEPSMVRRADIEHLPAPVRKYLEYVGAVGKPTVHSMRAVFRGSMRRSLDGDWIDITSQQYNFFGDAARVFYIHSAILGIPFDGLHVYVGDSATMQIKVAALVPVADARGEKMNQGETVTMFNDMCLLAPATLIDTSIQWGTVDSLRVRATFTNKGNRIRALLTFNKKGELTDFASDDRYYSPDGKTYTSYPWSTPVTAYKEYDGRRVIAYGEAMWHTPQGEYSYARFNLEEIEYNCEQLKKPMPR